MTPPSMDTTTSMSMNHTTMGALRFLTTSREPESEESVGRLAQRQLAARVESTEESKTDGEEADRRRDDVDEDDEDEEEDKDDESDGFVTPPVREYPEEYARYQHPQPSSASPTGSKRKRVEDEGVSENDVESMCFKATDGKLPLLFAPSGPVKRKGSSDFLRKGQWTPTEERLARLLIEAFEEGYLPIYTGIRLRGYLAVQLQCDPMRVSKKLCAGTIDGKRIPKNYGQKKFRLRKKQLWDRDEAGRILGTLERLTKELWAETGMSPPPYLTLSSTRNAEDDLPVGEAQPENRSPVKRLSPPANKSKKQKNGVVFPIIYLNLSKKMKQNGGAPNTGSNGGSVMYSSTLQSYGLESPYLQHQPDGSVHILGYGGGQNDSDSSSSSGQETTLKVDGESLQAAYELLNLHHHCLTPDAGSLTPEASHHHHYQRESTGSETSNVIHIRPAPGSQPAILRQQNVSSMTLS
ncbi:hypothetical protein Poli38472_007115 [Pythium oligandrum]|uniref:Uncharacterized protein n=1 Tax=Pythium oligandrum TaxID=41045 RepID=A0A8K1C9W8_PYTOL|nr:hypothetical protein Poli38472_007115 [Pythium oligandrum]|eukprot:TMW58970.1 hypothetical protein Poli38472_007115 [Pythium oligandrum]